VALSAVSLILVLATLDRDLLRHWTVIADVVAPGG